MTAQLASIALVAAFLTAAGPVWQPETANVPGTYELLVCKGPCGFDSPTNVVVKGLLVLTAEPFTPEALNPFSPLPFRYAYSLVADANGCFVVETLKANQTYAGIIDVGMTSWSVRSSQVSFAMYASPDAWHFVNATVTSGGFEGTGGSGGVGAAEAHLGPDVVKARRVAGSSLGECVRAAIEHHRKLRRAV
jgi:hypothetical protein